MSDLSLALILGVIEGVTEFLPISSTGHLLLANRWLGDDLSGDFWKRFVVFIQIGAIMAVVVYFRDRIRHLLTGKRQDEPESPVSVPSPAPPPPEGDVATLVSPDQTGTHLRDPVRTHPVLLVAIATAPVLVIGFLLHKQVERHLETPMVIATALIAGGALMILIELLRPGVRTEIVEDVTVGQALFIGMAQVLAAVFPGTSRSAATIMGGMLAGLSRESAAEFSFFLAIPSMFAACGFSLVKMLADGPGIGLKHGLLLVIGTLTSFLVAWVVIAGFMTYIRRYSFVPFAVYRILLGLAVFWMLRNAR